MAMEHAEFIKLKYGDLALGGWSPRLRERFGYETPDDCYELKVEAYVTPGTDWLDVGCGRLLFGQNVRLAAQLAARARSLDGIDPSANILENELLQHKEQCLLEDYRPGRQYDLMTLRMVVEHMTDPAASVAAMARLVRPGGHVIIYTVNKRSPIPVLSSITPTSFHVWAKRLLWNGEERDTFPTVYKMNTRKTLQGLFAGSFDETSFDYLSDTRTLAQFKISSVMELALWRGLKAMGILYPENCLLGVYTRLSV